MLDFDPASLIASLIISSIGFVALVYGKKQTRIPHMAAGAIMLVYPYFVSDVLLMSVIAVAILALLYGAVRFARL